MKYNIKIGKGRDRKLLWKEDMVHGRRGWRYGRIKIGEIYRIYEKFKPVKSSGSGTGRYRETDRGWFY